MTFIKWKGSYIKKLLSNKFLCTTLSEKLCDFCKRAKKNSVNFSHNLDSNASETKRSVRKFKTNSHLKKRTDRGGNCRKRAIKNDILFCHKTVENSFIGHEIKTSFWACKNFFRLKKQPQKSTYLWRFIKYFVAIRFLSYLFLQIFQTFHSLVSISAHFKHSALTCEAFF